MGAFGKEMLLILTNLKKIFVYICIHQIQLKVGSIRYQIRFNVGIHAQIFYLNITVLVAMVISLCNNNIIVKLLLQVVMSINSTVYVTISQVIWLVQAINIPTKLTVYAEYSLILVNHADFLYKEWYRVGLCIYSWMLIRIILCSFRHPWYSLLVMLHSVLKTFCSLDLLLLLLYF